jgi:CHAT domain-containing protein/Tfp pilus assembly protein PilF
MVEPGATESDADLPAAVSRLPALSPGDYPEEARALNERISELHQQGRYEEALAVANRACELTRAEAGPGHPAFALGLNNLGLLHMALGDYAAAEPLFRQALEVLRTALGERHPHYATCLNNLGALHLHLGNYAAAEPLLRQAVDVHRTSLAPDDPQLADSLTNLGMLYRATFDREAAAPLLREAQDVRRRALGERHPDVARSLGNLAGLYLDAGKWDEAEPLLRQALALLHSALGGQHPDVAEALYRLAEVYRFRGQPGQAEPLYRQAADIQRAALGEDHPALATTLANLARVCRDLGDPAQARALLVRVRDVRRSSLGEQHPDLAASLADLGSAQEALNELEAARASYQEALASYRQLAQLRPDTHLPDVARALGRLGDVQRRLNDLEAGHASYAEALAIRRRLAELRPELHGADVGRALDWLGDAQFELGDLQAARQSYREALDIFRQLARRLPDARLPTVASPLRKLGDVQRALGDLDGAGASYAEALDVYRHLAGPRPATYLPEVAATLDGLAALAEARGAFAAARACREEALAIHARLLGPDDPKTASSLGNLGALLRALGDLEGARAHLERALATWRRALGDEHPCTARALTHLAFVCAASGDDEAALRCLLQSAAADDRLLGQAFAGASERQRVEMVRSGWSTLDKALSLVWRRPAAEGVRAAFDLVLRRKALGAEAPAARRDAVLKVRHPALAVRLHELAAVQAQIAPKALAGPGPEGPAAHRATLTELEAWRERLEQELVPLVPELALERRRRAADRAAVARALPEEALLVEVVRFRHFDFQAVPERGEGPWGPARYLALTLPSGRPADVRAIDLGEAGPLDALVADFRHYLTLGKEEPETSLMLRRAVFDPLLPALEGRRRLILALDGGLLLLPFEALATEDGRHLIDDYLFSYVDAGRDLLRFEVPSGEQPGEPVVLADPEFDLAPGLGRRGALAPLPDSRLEGERVAALLGVRAWLGAEALKGRLRACRGPRVLHLVTHGFFVERARGEAPRAAPVTRIEQLAAAPNPLSRSGLGLAGANGWLLGASLPAEAEDGLLSAADVSALDLLDTDLVVVSACEDGVGETRAGERPLGLRRAFVLAGAKAVLTSLWETPYARRAELMEAFYGRLLAGQPRAHALREAQLAAKAQHPHPLDWAGFICLGDGGPLREGLLPLTARYRPFAEAQDPYVAGPPVAGKLFVGRADVLQLIRNNLAPAAGKNILVLRGQRRTGKTSVLLRLRDTLPEDSGGRYLPAFVSLQGLAMVQGDGAFFYHLARRIQLELQRHRVEAPRPERVDFDRDPVEAFELDFLARLTDVLGERRVLLMLDEFEKLKELIDEGRLGGRVLDYCRHLMQHTPLLFLIAGTHKLRELTGGYWSIFFNLGVPIDIGPLKEADARALITEPVQSWYGATRAAQDVMLLLTGCHPYFTQLVCKKLLEVRNEQRLAEVGVRAVREAVARALQTGEENVGYPWTDEDCGPDERLVLAVLASEARRGPVPLACVRKALAEAGQPAAVGEAADRLLLRGVVCKDGKDRLRFAVPLFHEWLERHQLCTPAAAAQYNRERAARGPRGPDDG